LDSTDLWNDAIKLIGYKLNFPVAYHFMRDKIMLQITTRQALQSEISYKKEIV
jgi:hypothetical protein